MGELTTKTVKVPESMAEEWDSYLEDNPEVDSISHLIRLSVQRQLQEGFEQSKQVSTGSDDNVSGQTLTMLRRLQTSINDLHEEVDSIRNINESEATYDLQRALFSLLPEGPKSMKYNRWALTCEELANKLGAEEQAVQESLNDLEEVTGEVRSVFGGPDDETYWFKQEK